MKRSTIGWTDFSGGPGNFVWRGSDPDDCKISGGCAHCYVDRIHPRIKHWPRETTVYPKKLERLLNSQFKPKGEEFRRGPGARPMVFVCDTGDLFHEKVDQGIIYRALDGFRARYNVTWQILTKRAERALLVLREYCIDRNLYELPSNIWMGVTIEGPAYVVERGEALLRMPANLKWISAEPLLGPLDGLEVLAEKKSGPDWIVAGGESGDNARPMSPDWVRGIRDICVKHGISFYFKQWGEWRHADDADQARGWIKQYGERLQMRQISGMDLCFYRVGRQEAGDILDGVRWQEFPL